nr:uncharacterized protein LOC117278604 [Nicotiana tomentosiformis]
MQPSLLYNDTPSLNPQFSKVSSNFDRYNRSNRETKENNGAPVATTSSTQNQLQMEKNISQSQPQPPNFPGTNPINSSKASNGPPNSISKPSFASTVSTNLALSLKEKQPVDMTHRTYMGTDFAGKQATG